MNVLDDFDLKILAILQDDARISMVDLGGRVGLSETSCARRVKRLEGDGIIKRYVALLDGTKVGADVKAQVQVRLSRQTQEAVAEFEKAIAKVPEVVDCDLVAGDYDYILYVRLKDLAALKDFIRDKLITISSVSDTRSTVTLETIKSTTAIPLPPLRRPRRT